MAPFCFILFNILWDNSYSWSVSSDSHVVSVGGVWDDWIKEIMHWNTEIYNRTSLVIGSQSVWPISNLNISLSLILRIKQMRCRRKVWLLNVCGWMLGVSPTSSSNIGSRLLKMMRTITLWGCCSAAQASAILWSFSYLDSSVGTGHIIWHNLDLGAGHSNTAHILSILMFSPLER